MTPTPARGIFRVGVERNVRDRWIRGWLPGNEVSCLVPCHTYPDHTSCEIFFFNAEELSVWGKHSMRLLGVWGKYSIWDVWQMISLVLPFGDVGWFAAPLPLCWLVVVDNSWPENEQRVTASNYPSQKLVRPTLLWYGPPPPTHTYMQLLYS